MIINLKINSYFSSGLDEFDQLTFSMEIII